MIAQSQTMRRYKPMEYRVTWTIDVNAESFEDAALVAMRVQRDPESIATHFEVKNSAGETRELCLSDRPKDEPHEFPVKESAP